MSETVPAVLSAVVENLTAPKEVHENEYQPDRLRYGTVTSLPGCSSIAGE